MQKATRRNFIKNMAAAGALAQIPKTMSAAILNSAPALSGQPNFVLLFTDQERATQHFPERWEENNLPNLVRLKQKGLTFNRCFINSAM